ncbi:MAG: FAD-binding protein [Vicinamibacterales bacterium]
MANRIVNYDGTIVTTPAQLVSPQSVEEIQAVLRDPHTYPGPVRAMGSYHSLTPCASTDGTIINMSGMHRVVEIDGASHTVTAQAGLQFIDASKALRAHDLQFMTNVEIGNMTLGSAACCHTKDALDGVEFGQVNSYLTRLKWVTPSGDLAEASEDTDPELLRKMRASYGLAGVIYEVSFRIKPIEALHFSYLPRPVAELTAGEVDHLLDSSEGLVCWTVGRTCVFQSRERIDAPGVLNSLHAAARHRLWNHGAAHIGHLVDQFLTHQTLREAAHRGVFDIAKLLYSGLHLCGGITLLAPDKIIDYRNTSPSARYAFTFWAFPRAQWLETLRAYLDFADRHYEATGFRCNMPTGAYYIHRDTHSLLSYSFDQEIVSIDPLHCSTDDTAWHEFLRRFNDFAYERQGLPLLNQSPFVERKHVEAAYGERWFEFSDWVRSVDPGGRMLNPFFAALLSQRTA